LEQLLSLEETVDDITGMIEDEEQLIDAHEKISELEHIRDTALNEIHSGMNYDIPMSVFEKYFAQIDKCGDSFTTMIWDFYLTDILNVCGMSNDPYTKN
jgi:hypothetical protein